MNTIVGPGPLPDAAAPGRPRLDHKPGKGTWALFVLLLAGLGYTAWSIVTDHAGSGESATSLWPFILLVLTCTGVSFSHGSNDGQKGMGLIMPILVGTHAQRMAFKKQIDAATRFIPLWVKVAVELVAMFTIGLADNFGLPVSATHVLSSGVAGTMAANKSGLQWSTIRNLAMAWVLTLPAAVVLSGSLYWLFAKLS